MSGVIDRVAQQVPVTMITGPRQVGKTSLLKHALGDRGSYTTLDDLTLREWAQDDPSRFLAHLKTPALIDEVQYVPNAMARDAGIDHKTAKTWLSILETCGLVYLLQSYYTHLHKRLIKAPKLYFLNTGLCAYLTRWTSPETLMHGAMSGAFFETFVVSEILKSYWHFGQQPEIYYYRDRDQVEVDLLLASDGYLHPVEIKRSASPSRRQAQAFECLKKLDRPIGEGALVCSYHQPLPLGDNLNVIPVTHL